MEMRRSLRSCNMLILVLSAAFPWAACASMPSFEIESPEGDVTALIFTDGDEKELFYTLEQDGRTVLEPSRMGIMVDGRSLGRGAELGEPSILSVRQRYTWRGVKSEALDHHNRVHIPVRLEDGREWTLEACVFDDGFAYRYVVPGRGSHQVTGEATEWNLPEGSSLWYHTQTAHYEAVHRNGKPEEIPLEKDGKEVHLGFPVTVELADGGYAALTEGNLVNYSGMTLKPTGTQKLKGVFEDDPKGFTLQGKVVSPWRITMASPDLNGLVNCDIIHNVCPPPDKELFPEGMNTEWIKPGRVLWLWWAYNDAGVLWDRQKKFVDQAAAFNCLYYLVDAGWENPSYGWVSKEGDSWARLKELCDYGAERGVGIWVWRSCKDCAQGPGIWTPEERRLFFARCKEAGVKGVKIDYMNSESFETLAFYQEVAKSAAQHQIMVDFHGANKPTGEARTWPHEMTREGIMGHEHNKWSTIPTLHYASLPFTRYLAGHGDFTPCTFQPSMLKGTTFTLQLAAAVVFDSPLLCWADKPIIYARSKVRDLIKRIPTTWDETRVLEGSRIGDLAAFARRKGADWYVGIINAGEMRTYGLDLSFLEEEEYNAQLVGDVINNPADMQVKRTRIKISEPIKVELAAGGGFVAHLSRNPLPESEPLTPPDSRVPDIHLSDLEPVKATLGWGSGINKDRSIEGNPLSVGGWPYTRGIGTHAPSTVIYNVKRGYKRFVAMVGVDDEVKSLQASVVFKVYADKNLIAESSLMTTDETWRCDVPLPENIRQIWLLVEDGGDGMDYDHADWAQAGFLLGD